MYGREAEMIDHLQGLLSEFRAGEHHHDERGAVRTGDQVLGR